MSAASNVGAERRVACWRADDRPWSVVVHGARRLVWGWYTTRPQAEGVERQLRRNAFDARVAAPGAGDLNGPAK